MRQSENNHRTELYSNKKLAGGWDTKMGDDGVESLQILNNMKDEPFNHWKLSSYKNWIDWNWKIRHPVKSEVVIVSSFFFLYFNDGTLITEQKFVSLNLFTLI